MCKTQYLACVLVLAYLVNKAAGKPPKVHVVFSQHLDVGFNPRSAGKVGTDDAAINLYFNKYFKSAAWLFSMFFDCPPGMGLDCPSLGSTKEVEVAIRHGDIFWHALPFNAQLEFGNRQLLQMQIFLVHQLDDRFNVTRKRVASLRDVPGITRAAMADLNFAGITALSQGVNGASAPPGIPKNTPVIWKDVVSGSHLIQWVHAGGYSGSPQDSKEECVSVEGFDHILCCAWKQDNEGPHTFEEANAIFDYYEAAFPGSEVVASTLDDYYRELEQAAPKLHLPTHTEEIGDTWIYGVPSDALKVSRFLAALRVWTAMSWRYDQYDFFNASRFLMKVSEHTWGTDIKTTIGDYENWSNAQFQQKLAAKAANFEGAVHSWRRQARYVDWALEALGLSPQALDSHLGVPLGDSPSLEHVAVQADGMGEEHQTASWNFAIDPLTGGLSKLQKVWEDGSKGVDWAAPGHPLAQLRYDTFLETDFHVIFDNYTFSPAALPWAAQDFGKLNCSKASPRHSASAARVLKMWNKQDKYGSEVVLHSELPEWSWREAGAPQSIRTRISSRSGDQGLYYDVSLILKTATRLPEAMWMRFTPSLAVADTASWRMYKLGQAVDPQDVMLNGSQSQHAVGMEGISVASRPLDKHGAREVLTIGSLDAVIVSPGHPTPFPVGNVKPDMQQGMAYCLLNNVWGTNYPQWQPYIEAGANLTFRFVLTVSRSSDDSQALQQQFPGRSGALMKPET